MKNEPQKDLSAIKEMMEKSTKFSSITGLSVFFSGLLAIIGAAIIYFDIGIPFGDVEISYSQLIDQDVDQNDRFLKIKLLVLIALSILFVSLVIIYFSAKQKSKKNSLDLFNQTFGRTFTSLSVPLLTGGVFSLFLIHHEMYGLVAPASLIFYGLGLINASKHSYEEFSVLGYAELLLGITASYFMGMGLLFWMIGFGLGHVILGLYLHFNYDRK